MHGTRFQDEILRERREGHSSGEIKNGLPWGAYDKLDPD